MSERNELNVSQLAAALSVPEPRVEEILRDHGIQAESGVPIWHGDLLDLLRADLARPQVHHADNGRIFASLPEGAEIELHEASEFADAYQVSEERIEEILAGYSTIIPGHYSTDVFPVLDAALMPNFVEGEANAD